MIHKNKTLTLEMAILIFNIITMTILIYGNYIHQYLIIPLALIIVMATISGFFIDNIILLWLIIILFFGGLAILLNFGTIFENNVKVILIILFPTVVYITSTLKRKVLSRVGIINNRKLIMNKAAKKNLVTNMGTELSFEKYYEKIIKQFSEHEPLVNITLVSLPYYEQRVQEDRSQLLAKLSEIATLLKNNRLPSERLFYIDNGEFIIVSLRVNQNEVNQLNEQNRQALKKIYFETKNKKHELRYQFATLKLDQKNPISVTDLLKKLHRQQETDLIDEYLL